MGKGNSSPDKENSALAYMRVQKREDLPEECGGWLEDQVHTKMRKLA